VRVEEGEDGKEEGKDYGERERGDIRPEVDCIFVELEFGHLGRLWGCGLATGSDLFKGKRNDRRFEATGKSENDLEIEREGRECAVRVGSIGV
jgi:hypothetical protein